MFTEKDIQEMQEGLELFNKQLYWECHEFFEELWLEERQSPDRYLYWAIIQVAASLHHVQNQNKIGAYGLLAKAKEKIKKCEESHLLSPENRSELSWDRLTKEVEAIKDSEDFVVFHNLLNFKFPLKG